MKMEPLRNIPGKTWETMKGRIPFIVSYFDVLYFFEIIYLMLTLLVLYGKAVSAVFGTVAAVLLSAHILSLYAGKGRNRKVQLFLMDLHLAMAVPVFLNIVLYGFNGTPVDAAFTLVRLLIASAEPFLICLLTGEEGTGAFA